jgi:hypothetical protein
LNPVITGNALSIRDLEGISWNSGCPRNPGDPPISTPCGSAVGSQAGSSSTSLQIEVGIYDVTDKYPVRWAPSVGQEEG